MSDQNIEDNGLENGVPVGLTPHTMKRVPGLPPIARPLLTRFVNLKVGELTVITSNGGSFTLKGEQPGVSGTIRILDDRFWRRVIIGGDMGLAESYMDGEWDTPDLTAVIQVMAANIAPMGDYMKATWGVRLFNRLLHLLRHNSKTGSRKNIEAHYDLGNEFYKAWLDDTMTYSSARFSADDQDLAGAQSNKYASLARQLDLKPGHEVLEIGCGWGGFAEYAAREVGAKVTGITISPSQLDFAQKRIFEKGLNEKVNLILKDYRDLEGSYDRIASIEMFEAVGEQYWPAFFGKVFDVLKPGGQAGLQIITIKDEFFDHYRKGADFIQRYIFPGGMLPSEEILRQQIADADLNWNDNTMFGVDYAQTLAIWRDRFLQAWPMIEPMGFDPRFQRMWVYYLSYCEAGFRAGNINVGQYTMSRD